MNMPDEFLASPIKPYITINVPTLRASEPVAHVGVLMENKSNPYGVVLITDDNDCLKGVITRGDLTKLISQKPSTAADLGTMQNVVAISNGARVWQMLKIMNGENKAKKWFNMVPVVDQAKKPVGIIRRETLLTDIPKNLADCKKSV